MDRLADLARHLARATGRDAALNAVIATALDRQPAEHAAPAEPPDYTGSVDACLALIARVLPGWHWHVGHGANGVLPYAALTLAEGEGPRHRAEATAPTVPLALLRALVSARRADA